MTAVVTIGFVKDAKHHIDVQGFNVYHKNRLIKVCFAFREIIIDFLFFSFLFFFVVKLSDAVILNAWWCVFFLISMSIYIWFLALFLCLNFCELVYSPEWMSMVRNMVSKKFPTCPISHFVNELWTDKCVWTMSRFINGPWKKLEELTKCMNLYCILVWKIM